MKKIKFLFIFLLGIISFNGYSAINEGFESSTTPATGWTYNSVTHGTNNPKTGLRCATFNASGDYIITPLLSSPDVLSFYFRRSGTSPTSPKFTVQYSSSILGPWTDLSTSSPINSSPANPIITFTTTYVQFTANLSTLSNIYIRVIDGRSAGANELYIDDFTVSDYTGLLPEIQLQQPIGTDIVCGLSYDYTSQNVYSNTDITIRIKNTGTSNLNISSTTITGTNSSEFNIITPPTTPITPGSQSDMVVRFSPLINGSKSATLTINSNDVDEGTCTIGLTGSATYTSCSELIISEYGEPVVGSGKYIEIYNGTSGSIDLSNYQLWRALNGSAWPGASGSPITLSGTIASNSTYLIANNSTDVPGANLYNSTICNWNGNDAVGLARKIGSSFYLIDAVGEGGIDPITGWSVAGITNATSDHTLVRKSTINIPNTNWTSSSGTTSSNSEWIVKPYGLSNTGCNVSSCFTTNTVGFNTTLGSTIESNTTLTLPITMNTTPTSTVSVNITDALLGTASTGIDYSFTPTTLTFTPIETYPNTKNVSITILDDAISESNENVVLDLDAQCGSLVINNRYTLTIIDNEIPEGVVINEFSQGSASKEYLELVVIGTPGSTVDLRGWIIDDNSGIFSGGYGTNLGIAAGHVKFSNECSWEKVPVGSIILLYNSTDKNASITIPDDPTDGNLDYVYVIGIESAPSSCSTMPTTNLYFSSDCTIPNNSSYDTYTPPSYTNVDWNAMQFRNAGDALQIRSNNGGFFHGLSYGNKGSGSDCSSCQLNQSNHPDYSVYGTNSLYFTGSSNITYANLNLVDNDFRKLNNWSVTTSSSPNSLETPGTFNDNSLNKNWILSLRTPFDVVIDDQSYTCDLRALESRYYLDNNDKIIFYIKNNTSTNHGSFTAQTIIHNTATTGKGFQNLNLYGLPVFMQKTFVATPTTSTPANYKIKFYVTTQELQDYCNYINPLLQSVFGNPHSYTPSNVISHLKIYRTSTTDRAWTVTSDPQVQIVVPVVGTYGAYTTFEYDGFTNFSGYALGDIITPVVGLPIEMNEFKSNCDNDITKIHFSTLSQSNVDYFILQKSEDGRNWSDVKKIKGEIFSNQLKEYNFTDEAGYSYYRIKEVDLDGKIIYSRIILSNCSGGKSTLIRQIDNTIIISSNENITTDVYAIDGKLIRQSNSSELNLNGIAKGIYIIKCYSDDMRINITKKIIIK